MHPPRARERKKTVTLRWTFRAAACLMLLLLAACSGATATPTLRSNEVQVIEPVGREPDWTFAPQELRVTVGTTVTFVNKGKEFHTATSDDPGRPFDVGFDPGKSATVTFDKVGVFGYHCGVHPQMKGVVRVCDGSCT